MQTQAFFLVDVSYQWNWLVSKYKHKQVSCYLNPVRLTQAFFLVNVSYGNDEVKKMIIWRGISKWRGNKNFNFAAFEVATIYDKTAYVKLYSEPIVISMHF